MGFSISKYISIPVFFVSFCLGLLFVYILGPDVKKIEVYPSPENVDKLQIKDDANNCYKYKQKHVECPSDETLITKLPLPNTDTS